MELLLSRPGRIDPDGEALGLPLVADPDQYGLDDGGQELHGVEHEGLPQDDGRKSFVQPGDRLGNPAAQSFEREGMPDGCRYALDRNPDPNAHVGEHFEVVQELEYRR